MDHAHHFSIGSASFTSGHTVTTNNHHTTNLITQHIQPSSSSSSSPSSSIDSIEILRRARAVEATHTSPTASYAPKCKPGTRATVISDMMSWIQSDDDRHSTTQPTTSILWFSGPAGGGKTCIMRDVVDRCTNGPYHLLAASYFFSTRVPGLDHERPFVATIAHQLAVQCPVLKDAIMQTIRDNPTIFEESLDFQMSKLVVEPLGSEVFRGRRKKKVVIVIDGFDECRNPLERQHLFRLLHSLAVSNDTRAVLILIASRPELDVRTIFETRQFKPITHVLRLEDYDGTEDIRVFLCDEFERIRETHLLRASIPRGWPSEMIVNVLIQKSSGNFIYPSTLMKHVDNPRRNPVESLMEVLALSGPSPSSPSSPSPTPSPPSPSTTASAPGSTAPLAELDALYTLILHPAETDIQLMKRLLHCLLGLASVDNFGTGVRSSTFLDELLRLAPDTTSITLCDLHSVLSIPSSRTSPLIAGAGAATTATANVTSAEAEADQTGLTAAAPSPSDESTQNNIRFLHKTLEDYLLSPERSLDLYQAPYETQFDITIACCGHLEEWAASSSRPVGSVDSPSSTDNDNDIIMADIDTSLTPSASFNSGTPELTRTLNRPTRYATERWDDHIKLCFKDKPLHVRLPEAIMQFDPRIRWRSQFVYGGASSTYFVVDDIREDVHQTMCHQTLPIKGPCTPFCKLLTRLSQCRTKTLRFHRSMRPVEDTQARIDALPQFDVETGLYTALGESPSSSRFATLTQVRSRAQSISSRIGRLFG